jgi:signal transduction histidine kinase/CheY-like chemotaxis protein/HPt (histidine-containing phosphotransfer) domain-containing protein
MAIFHRLLLAFLGVGVLIGVPLIVVSLDFSRDSARLRTEQSVTQQIAIVAANFEQEFGLGLNRSLKQITSSDALTQYLSASQDERMVNARGLETSFLKSQTDYEIYSGIYYVDVFGHLVASVEDGKRVNWDEQAQPSEKSEKAERSPTAYHFKRLFDRITTTPSLLSSGNMEWFMPPRQLVVEGPFIDEQGRWSLLAGLPSLDFDNGALSGAAVIRVRLDGFLSRLKTITLFDEPVIWLFGPGPQVLLKPEKTALTLARSDVGDQVMVKDVILSKRDDDLVAYRDLAIVSDQPFLRIVYAVPNSLLSRDFEPALYFFIMVLAISGVAVLTAAYFVAKNFSAPIIELAQAASRLARGELAGRVKVRSSGELMVLVDSFNRMSENLQLANDTRSSAFEVLRKTAAQMQVPEVAEANRPALSSDDDGDDGPAPGQEDAQDLRAISDLITQLIAERAENLRNTRDARDSAEQANRAKSQFLANMSHEIRTPLNAVLGMLKLLQSTSLSSRQADYVAKTEGAARSLLFLLNDILDFSKVEADKMSLDPRPFRIDQLMRDLSVILSASIGSKPVEVLFDIDAAVPRTLIGDDLRLQQVLINLGGNAIKFTERGEVVVALRCVSLDQGQALLDFSVRDTGIGIPADQHTRIFDGFSQAEASTTRRFGGTGLGLAICQRLVGLMGGRIQVASEPGVGSQFSFQVSLPIDMQAHAALETSESALRGLTDLHALVVDDNPTARQVLSEMVASLGWRVDVAASGPEAVAKARQQAQEGAPYDVAFVDWQMPGMDGWETSLRMREAQGPAASATVMMVTAHGREMLSGRSAAEQAALGGFLVKPVTASMLLDAVIGARLGMAEVEGLPETLRPPAGKPERPRRLQDLRLLVVEDNANNRQVAQELLRAEGAYVELAENGQIGLACLDTATLPFDAVLMDLQMPVMDGFTATAQLRRQERWAGLPVIAMTANALESDRQACLAAGMTDHVGKPFDLDDLVGKLLQHARPQQWTARDSASSPSYKPELPEQALEIAQELGVQALPAVMRLGGNVGTYARMWSNFLQDLAPTWGRLEQQMARAQWSEAAAEMHMLKGLAGMLGHTALADLCRLAETGLQPAASPSPTRDWYAPMGQIVGLLSERGDSLVQVLVPQGAEGGAMSLMGVAEVSDALGALSLLLAASDMKAVDAFEPLRSSPVLMEQAMFGEVCGAMDRLDFERAGRLVSDLMRILNA